MTEIDISQLHADEASSLARLLAEQADDYMHGFFPFAFDAESLQKRLVEAKADQYWSLRWQGKLAGFCMLRGLDEGYERPSFGVFVAEDFAGKGLSTAGLEHALGWCREQGIGELMLKVDPENARAVTIYRKAGFVIAGKCPDTGQDIMIHKDD